MNQMERWLVDRAVFCFSKKLSGVGKTAITKYSIFPPEFAHQVKLLLSLPLQFKLKFKKATLL